ncbi:MAG: cell division protein FtsA [Candidatus Margulisiibacteriota bacterium]|jgi:cell division protein FtsA
MKTNNNFILGLDIGSNQIRALVCEIDKNKELFLKTYLSANFKGLEKGRVTNKDELKNVLEDIIFKLTKKLLVRPNKVIVNIPLYKLNFSFRTGILSIKNQDSIVTQFDKNKCIERAKNSFHLLNKQIMHVIPFNYKLDNKDLINPLNKKGNLLEVNTHLISCDQENIHAFIDVLHELDLKVLGLVYDALGISEIFIPFSNRKEGAFLMDFGARFCRINYFKNNLLASSLVIPIGGETINHDLKQCLNISLHEAERIKILYGNALVYQVNSEEMIEIMTNNKEHVKIKRQLLCQIIEARLNELINLIKKRFPLIFENHPLFLTGKSSKLLGFDQFLAKKLKLKVITKMPENVSRIIDQEDYLNALGLLVYGYKNKAYDFISIPNNVTLLDKLKKMVGSSYV